ncbi:phosphomannomutase, partial [Brucellaceae bacterium D45D]
MAVSFGTSGLRGPAADFTDKVCAAYIFAFLKHLARDFAFQDVYVAADFRESSPRIAKACIAAIQAQGKVAMWAGNVPTPALASYAMAHNAPAIMITGSHIPETYNGIKFYRPDGEFLKDDEAPVRVLAEERLGEGAPDKSAGNVELGSPSGAVAQDYISRAVGAFGGQALSGLKIGIDLHSAVGRDLLVDIFKGLGAEVHPFRRVEQFIAVDTEALDPVDLERSRNFIAEHQLDAVISTDGDGDRPLVIDEQGRQVNGDILGILTAKFLGARTIVTPLS